MCKGSNLRRGNTKYVKKNQRRCVRKLVCVRDFVRDSYHATLMIGLLFRQSSFYKRKYISFDFNDASTK